MPPERVLDDLAHEHGLVWTLVEHVHGGGKGIQVADTGEGLDAFKVSTHPGALREHSVRVAMLERLRARGYPMPRHDPPIALSYGAVVRPFEWLAHVSRVDRLTPGLFDALTDASGRQQGAEPEGRGWEEFLMRTLTEGADGWCLHETLRGAGGRPAELIRRVGSVVEGSAGAQPPSTDAMHLDLHVGNLLLAAGALAAVIDWGGARAGDRMFDLVTLAFATTQPDPEVDRRLARLLDVEPDVMALYVAHLSLRLVDWSLRKRPTEVDYWLDRSTHWLDRHT